MHWWLVPASYLIGSISFSLLVVSFLERRDLRELGSGNAGATNVLRVAGKAPAIATLLLDIGKGALPVWLGLRIDAPDLVLGLSALAVVLGHIFPVFHGFRGGKGVATAVGALAVLQPVALVISLVLFAATVLSTRYVSLASMVGISAYPVIVAVGWLSGQLSSDSWSTVAASAAITAVVLFKHRENMARLQAGSEPRIGEGRRSG